MVQPDLILASASPRRRALLEQLGLRFSVLEQDIDESRRVGESPLNYVERMAQEKAGTALKSLPPRKGIIIGADTSVVLDDLVLGKPRDEFHGRQMLMQLSGREHQVLSAVTVCSTDACETAVSVSTVTFRVISPLEASSYWATGEPIGKAGSYAIQGLAAVFVKHLAGSYSGVMGLPLFETAQLLKLFGIDSLPLQAEQ